MYGGIILSYSQLHDFNECMDTCSLTDNRSNGGEWTWYNKVLGPKELQED